MQRFDYTPEDCERFHAAIEEIVVPAARELGERRRQQLGLEVLRPWDINVDPTNQPPLRPFETAGQLCEGCQAIFMQLDPELGDQFQIMAELGFLDLENRKGKAPGGYMSEFQEYRLPFIFMNAVGRHTDVQTLLHEAGHAFHAFACRHEPLTQYRSAPMEFSEVASMGMEMLSLPRLDVFYEEKDRRRACREHLESIIRLLPRVASIDAFQHWLYTHPEHTQEDRNRVWLDLHRRFGGIEDYTGFEDFLEIRWQRVLHLYEVPFYFIEYGIAQVGALQLWLKSLQNPEKTMHDYRCGLALGGSQPLPNLFASAGIRFDVDAETLRPLVDAVMAEIRDLEN
jgi:oligoendopeptidase F